MITIPNWQMSTKSGSLSPGGTKPSAANGLVDGSSRGSSGSYSSGKLRTGGAKALGVHVTSWDVDVAGVGDVVAATAAEMESMTSAGGSFADASSVLAGAVTGSVASTLADVLAERTGTVDRISVYADTVVDALRTAIASYIAADVSMADTVKRQSESPMDVAIGFEPVTPGPGLLGVQ